MSINDKHNKPVLLAFSGGLDTSYCARRLSAVENMTVHTLTVNTGGFSPEEMAAIEQQAYASDSARHINLDETDNFYRHCLKYLVFANALRGNVYPLSVSAERVFQAGAIARYARKHGAGALAHGSTGAGNDQVRFDTAFAILAPELPILTPVRDKGISREQAVAFLHEHGCTRDWSRAAYSINKGLWGTTIGGKETLGSTDYLPEEAFPTAVSKQEPEEVSLEFSCGELRGLNGRRYDNPVTAIRALQALAQPFGIGRDIHVGDTIIGLKGRVAFEAAAPVLIIKAHHALEKHCLSARQQRLKEFLSADYADMIHAGHFYEPAMRNCESFLSASQATVSGTVRIALAPWRFHILGVQSHHDLMQPRFGRYGEMNTAWSSADVRGFARIRANAARIFTTVNGEPHAY